MLIGHFTEQPWQDENTGLMGRGNTTLDTSNRVYDPKVGAKLYNRYIDEKLFAEEMGFEALMLNEHHSTPFCVQGVTNVEAFILARQTKKAKIVINGNILPLWDDPLWLAEMLAMGDMISEGRIVSGFVRGGGTESISHNANPTINRERFNEAHDMIIKAWTTPGPFRWEGKHYQYRYVNPWAMPYQQPHPMVMVPGVISPETAKWTAQHRYPYILLATLLEPTKKMFDLYYETAAEAGYKTGPQNIGYLFKVHLEDTDEKAYEVGRKYIAGVANPFIAGNAAEGRAKPWIQSPPGLSSRTAVAARVGLFGAAAASGADSRAATIARPYEDQVKTMTIITGTPKSVLPKIKQVLEYLRPGTIFLWDGDGSMSHEDQMRSMRLMGQELIPWAKELGKGLDLKSPWEVNDGTGYDQAAWKRQQAEAKTPA
jgi:alkanesulfonate monooxygenase SsuD/methylene tetrahydromethanopterin reductase-like flavin-dependent oxidoreductase (luciferase family)